MWHRRRRKTGKPTGSFFPKVAAEVLTPFMAGHGFRLAQEEDWGVTYRRNDRVASFSYDTRDRFLSIGIGLADPDGRRASVGLWRALKETGDEVDYSSWDFSTEAELREVLARVIHEAMPHAVSLWSSEERIRALLDEQGIEVEQHRQEHIRSQELAAARRAFEAGRYAEARDDYVLIGEDELSAADRRRLYLARKHLSAPEA